MLRRSALANRNRRTGCLPQQQYNGQKRIFEMYVQREKDRSSERVVCISQVQTPSKPADTMVTKDM